MRLLQVDENDKFSLTDDLINNIPPYAILSHTWGEEHEEVSFIDLTRGLRRTNAGYKKLCFCKASCTRWPTILLGGYMLHYTDPPSMTMPYKKSGTCRRKRRESSPSFKYQT